MENRITALIVQKRNPERMNVFMDGSFSFSVSRLVGAWLKVGQPISQQRIKEIQSVDEVDKAFQSAVHFLSFRNRSEIEIQRNLEKKEYSQITIGQTINKLKEADLVNDAKFACQWVESRVLSKPRSRRLMEYELRQKKVLDDQIQQAFETIPDDFTLALQAARKKMHQFSYLEKDAFRKKMTSFLMRRGFQYDIIRQTLDQIGEELDLSNGKKNL
jgi:regulatory protein